ncbi:MAG: ComEC family competence protein [Holosporaceae bacterium]|jgi:competence protein ComEC|nr:ComEC family competence protein [Holosporaceae bacterium]
MYTDRIENYLRDLCDSERRRLLNLVPVGLGVGVCIYFSLDDEPSIYLGVCLLLLTIAVSIFVRKYRWIFWSLLTVALGFLAAQIRTKTVDTFMLSEKINEPISLIATVASCEKSEKGVAFVTEGVKILPKSLRHWKFNKLYLTWRGKKALASEKDYLPGARVLFRAILSPMDPLAFPGAYDFKKQAYFKGISARGFIIKEPKILEEDGLRSSFALWIERLRHRINKKIENYLPRDVAGVSEALITGNKTGISKDVRAYFANSGAAHILAISGLHIGIIGFFIFWLFRLLLCCIPGVSMFRDVKKMAAVVSWLAVLFYLHVSGSSVPSLRAFIMHSLIMAAILLGRTALTMRSVAIAATFILLCTPEVIMFPSFQMSFGAVMAIVAFYECSPNFRGFFRTLLAMTATTVVATAPTSIFSINAFNQLTLNSIPANLLSIPLMTFFIMPLAVAVLFSMAFGGEYPFVFLMGQGVQLLMKISQQASKLPGSCFVMHTPAPYVMAIVVFSGLLIVLVRHRIRLYGFLGLFVGVILYFLQPLPDVFVSRDAKAVGIRTKDGVYFNHLGHCRSTATAWAKSVGFGDRRRFDAKDCDCISEIAEGTRLARVKNCKVIVADKENYEKPPDVALAIRLNEKNDFAQLIYLPSQRRISNESKKRPWS